MNAITKEERKVRVSVCFYNQRLFANIFFFYFLFVAVISLEGAERPRAPLARAVAHFMGYRLRGGGSGATASAPGASGRSF